MHKGITLKDLALSLKLSVSTVSRALKGHYSISHNTISRVLALSEELGYQPNRAAQSLVNNKSYTIGVLVPDITNHFYANIISGIEAICLLKGYNVILCQSNESLTKETKSLQTLISSGVDGILLCLSKETKDISHLNATEAAGIPMVLFDRIGTNTIYPSVTVDDFEGSFNAVTYLITKGCKKIAHISGPLSLSNATERLKGYIHALNTNSIEIDPDLICETDLSTQQNTNISRNLLQSHKPDAIFAFNDYVAYDAMREIQNLGLKLPADISLIGFGNEPVSGYVSPTLTTVAQPSFEIGNQSIQMLLNQIQKKDSNPNINTILKTQLIKREST